MVTEFWNGIIRKYSIIDLGAQQVPNLDQFITDLFNDEHQPATQKSLIEELFAQQDVLKELIVLQKDVQKIILLKTLKYATDKILDNEAVLSFAFKNLDTGVLQELNKNAMLRDKIPDTFIPIMLKACHTSKVWALYFQIIDIYFSPTSGDANFFEDLKKPENDQALKHIKKALRLSLKNCATLLKSVIDSQPMLGRLMIAELLEESNGFEDWERYFAMYEIQFKHGNDNSQLIQDLNKNPKALEKILPDLLSKSQTKPSLLTEINPDILQEHIENIPIDSIILQESPQIFEKHPQYALFFPNIQWSELFSNHMDILEKLNPDAIRKLFESNDTNPFEIIYKSTTDRDIKAIQSVLGAIEWVLGAIDKTGNKKLLSENFKKTNEKGSDALMLAAYCQPAAVAPILDAIDKAGGKELLSEMLKKTNIYGSDALMLAAEYQLSAVAPILNAIDKAGGKELLSEMLKKTNNYGYDALMLAAQYQPAAVAPILNVIVQTGGKELLSEMLKKTDKLGYDALMLAALCKPAAVADILETVLNTLDVDAQKSILDRSNEWINNYKAKTKLPFNTLLKLSCQHPAIFQKLQINNSDINSIVTNSYIFGKTSLNWGKFITDFTEKFDKIDPFILKLQPNILIELAKLKHDNDKDLIFILKKLEELQTIDPQAANQIIQEFTCSTQKLKTKNPEIPKLLIKLLLKNPEQKTILKTVQERCALESIELLGIINEFSEEELYRLLTQVFNNHTQGNILLDLILNQNTVNDFLKIISKLGKEKQKEIFEKTDKFGKTLLRAATTIYQDNIINQIVQAIFDSGGKEFLSKILQKTYYDDTKKETSVLFYAANCNPGAVAPILQAIDKTQDKKLLYKMLLPTQKGGVSPLLCTIDRLISHKDSSGVSEILKRLESLDVSKQDAILTNVVERFKLMDNSQLQLFIPCLTNIFTYHLKDNKYNPKFKINVDDAQFNIMQGVYHLYGYLKNNEKTLKLQQLKALKAIIDTLKNSENQSVDVAKILKTLQEISLDINPPKTSILKKRLNDLEQAFISYLFQTIEWPDFKPYSLIEDKKNIDSIIRTISPEWLYQHPDIATFKPIFQRFPEDWKVKYLHECRKTLKPEFYQYIYDELESSNMLDKLPHDIEDTTPSAPPIEEAQAIEIPSSDENSSIAVVVAEPYINTHDSKFVDGRILHEPEIKSQFWISVRGENKEEFLKNFKALNDIEMTYRFINYMRNLPLMGAFRQNIYIIRKWIEEDPTNKTQFYLDELIYFAKHYENLANNIEGSSPKKTALINLSKDLINLKSGLDLIYSKRQETSTEDSYGTQLKIYEHQLKIYELHRKWISHYLVRFESFNKSYPGIMNFTSVLQHPNGTYAHTLVELAPRKPIAPILEEKRIESATYKNTEVLIHSIKDEKKTFIQKIQNNANEPQFFKQTESKSKKNLLLLALETKDIDKINAVAKTIYEFNEEDRKGILATCNQKGYRLTSYIRQKNPYLCLLELERLVLKLENLNPLDPNIKVLKGLSSQLRVAPDDYLDDIGQARKDLKKNSSWRQWFRGRYASTDYGIGIFKETIDGLLDKIEVSMPDLPKITK